MFLFFSSILILEPKILKLTKHALVFNPTLNLVSILFLVLGFTYSKGILSSIYEYVTPIVYMLGFAINTFGKLLVYF